MQILSDLSSGLYHAGARRLLRDRQQLGAVLSRDLAREPSDRHPTAREMREALLQATAGARPAPPAPPAHTVVLGTPAPPRSAPERRRRPAWRVADGLFLLGSAMALLILVAPHPAPPPGPPGSPSTGRSASRRPADADRFLEDVDALNAIVGLARGDLARPAKQVTGVDDLLDRAKLRDAQRGTWVGHLQRTVGLFKRAVDEGHGDAVMLELMHVTLTVQDAFLRVAANVRLEPRLVTSIAAVRVRIDRLTGSRVVQAMREALIAAIDSGRLGSTAARLRCALAFERAAELIVPDHARGLPAAHAAWVKLICSAADIWRTDAQTSDWAGLKIRVARASPEEDRLRALVIEYGAPVLEHLQASPAGRAHLPHVARLLLHASASMAGRTDRPEPALRSIVELVRRLCPVATSELSSRWPTETTHWLGEVAAGARLLGVPPPCPVPGAAPTPAATGPR